MNIPEDLLFTREHEWVRIEGNRATVGISDYAQHALGDVTFVELPTAGKKMAGGDKLAAVESVKAASDVYAPVSGAVLEVNQALETAPELLNQEPYGRGWLAVIEISEPGEKNKLMTPEAYAKYLETL